MYKIYKKIKEFINYLFYKIDLLWNTIIHLPLKWKMVHYSKLCTKNKLKHRCSSCYYRHRMCGYPDYPKGQCKYWEPGGCYSCQQYAESLTDESDPNLWPGGCEAEFPGGCRNWKLKKDF